MLLVRLSPEGHLCLPWSYHSPFSTHVHPCRRNTRNLGQLRYVGKDFPLQDPTETVGLSFDFSRHPDWKLWDAISSATVTVEVVDGTDADADDRLDGSPTIWMACVVQVFANPVDGVKYKLVATATTCRGEVLALYSNVTGQA